MKVARVVESDPIIEQMRKSHPLTSQSMAGVEQLARIMFEFPNCLDYY